MLGPERLQELADSYLDHLLLIFAVDDRGASLRDFLDPWWAFSRGLPFVKDNVHPSQYTMNNPCGCGCEHRQRLPALDWISVGAQAVLARRVCKYKMKDGRTDLRPRSDQLIVDHSVPLSVIYKIIFDGIAWDRNSLREMLNHHLKRGLLTRAEDDRLNEKLGGRSLRADMPLGWLPGDDPFARYSARAIDRSLVG